MLVTDVGDQMCWGQFKDVGNGFGHRDINSAANILKLSPTASHQHHSVINMTVVIFMSSHFVDKHGVVDGNGSIQLQHHRSPTSIFLEIPSDKLNYEF